MSEEKYKSALLQTINNLVNSKKDTATSVDMGSFIVSLKKELIGLKLPVYNVYLSHYRNNTIVIELPFCKSCEVLVDSVEFGSEKKQVSLFIDKKQVRRIHLVQLDSKYMSKVAIAIADYFKRFLLLKNKFEGN